ncbi:type II secretion system secretin GspD [Desulfofustis limnaeus]|nr:type II secretion system secretin GspD [Desulfofustis limnaeus]
MNSLKRHASVRCCLLLGAVMVLSGLCAVSVVDAQEPKGERYITIDFDNVDINLFIKYMSELTGRNFIVDPNVRGNVTIISPTRISETDAYHVFESVLEIHGFTTVASGSVIKIVPSVEARAKSIETLRPGDQPDPQDRVVTQLVPLTYTTPLEMQKILQPLVSKTSVLLAHTPSGMLIITDTMSNIKRLLDIIEVLDVEYTRDEILVLPLQYANAENLATILNTIFQKATAGGKEEAVVVTSAVKVVPYERINLLIVLAEPTDAERVRKLVEELDTEARRGEGNIHVVYLQNARAAELAKVLGALPQEEAAEAAEGKTPAISKAVNIMPDEETNSLIITASRSEFTVLEEVIQKLDIPRRMVYLEALIMEVDADRSFDVGVQWLAGGIFDDGTGKLVTGFSGEPAYGLITGITDPDNPALPTGFTLGVLKEGIEIGGITFPNIAAVLRAYQGDSDINIISTPQILTTDNKKAEILVGQNVPYITSQNTTSGLQDYTQYEYRDVATKLGITPQISQGDTLRLEIATEVTRLKQGSTEDQFRPTTFKRTAETTVIVRDRETIVIGGIIGQDTTNNEFKIPLLGDIPLIGWLFKTSGSTDTKVNMFIFITPHIIKNPADIAEVSLEREDRLSEDMPRAREELRRNQPKPEHGLVLADRGYEALRNDDLKTARDYLIKALQIDEHNPYALINLGVVYQKEGDYPRAIEMYRKVIETGTEATAMTPADYHGEDLSLVTIARQNIEFVEQLMQK